MKVVVYGSRETSDYNQVVEAIEKTGLKIKELVVASTKDVGANVESYAKTKKIKLKIIKPEWDNLEADGAVVKTNSYGKEYNSRAAFDANQKIAEYVDCAIEVSYDKDMNERLTKLNKPIHKTEAKVNLSEKYRF